MRFQRTTLAATFVGVGLALAVAIPVMLQQKQFGDTVSIMKITGSTLKSYFDNAAIPRVELSMVYNRNNSRFELQAATFDANGVCRQVNLTEPVNEGNPLPLFTSFGPFIWQKNTATAEVEKLRAFISRNPNCVFTLTPEYYKSGAVENSKYVRYVLTARVNGNLVYPTTTEAPGFILNPSPPGR